MSQQFFYDEQIRRFLLQFTRVFSNFEVEYGRDANGVAGLYRVPIRYGDASRQAQTILQNNSANSIPSTPMMSFYVTSLSYSRSRVQEPYFVDRKSFRQRAWDTDTESYEVDQGNAFTVERLMPVPYDLEIQLDIWTSNTHQKLQLLEQILTLFNPALEIQSTDNYIDWTSLSVIELTNTTWSSRTVPSGTDDPIDIASLRFELPIWISPPARVKKLGVVEKIIASLYDGSGNLNEAIYDNDLLLGTRQKFTPYDYNVILVNGQIQALPAEDHAKNNDNDVPEPHGTPASWTNILENFSAIRNGISQVRFDNPHDPESLVVGTVTLHPNDDTILLFSVDNDTIPANTLLPVNAIVDPQRKWPSNGLPDAASGQRYLLVGSTGNDGGDVVHWRGTNGADLDANTNNIIEFDGTQWNVVFSGSDSVEYVSNLTTSIQYRWASNQWLKSYEGLYAAGEWTLVI